MNPIGVLVDLRRKGESVEVLFDVSDGLADKWPIKVNNFWRNYT